MAQHNHVVSVTIGCDPEIFIQDKTGKIVSAHDLLPGTKEKPFKTKYGAIQVDGVAAEINTTPTDNYMTFSQLVKSQLDDLQARLPEHKLKIQAAYSFPKAYMDKLPEEVKLLGCNPDYNAWTEKINPMPDGNATTMRTTAGHLHIGFNKSEDPMEPFHFADCCRLVRQLDYYVGVPTLLWDTDPRRRELYGKAGAFRPKTYGLEYRTPSSMWLKHQNLYHWLHQSCTQAVNGLVNGSRPYLPEKFETEARDRINAGDKAWAKKEFKQNIWPYTGLAWPEW